MGSFGLKAFALGMNDEINTLGQLALGIGAADPTGMFPANGVPNPNAAMQPMQPMQPAQQPAPPVMQPAAGWGQPAAPAQPAGVAQPVAPQGYSPSVGTAQAQAAPAQEAPAYPAAPEGVNQQAWGIVNGLQDMFGPLKIISSYRDPERNAAVGGAKHSRHIQGDAFDVDVSHMSTEERIEFVRESRARGVGGVGIYDNTIHLDFGPERAWGPSHHADSIPEWARGVVGSSRQITKSAQNDLGPEGPHYGTPEDYEDLKDGEWESETSEDLELTSGQRWGVALSGLGKGLGQMSRGQPVDIGDILEKHYRRQEIARGRLSELNRARMEQQRWELTREDTERRRAEDRANALADAEALREQQDQDTKDLVTSLRPTAEGDPQLTAMLDALEANPTKAGESALSALFEHQRTVAREKTAREQQVSDMLTERGWKVEDTQQARNWTVADAIENRGQEVMDMFIQRGWTEADFEKNANQSFAEMLLSDNLTTRRSVIDRENEVSDMLTRRQWEREDILEARDWTVADAIEQRGQEVMDMFIQRGWTEADFEKNAQQSFTEMLFGAELTNRRDVVQRTQKLEDDLRDHGWRQDEIQQSRDWTVADALENRTNEMYTMAIRRGWDLEDLEANKNQSFAEIALRDQLERARAAADPSVKEEQIARIMEIKLADGSNVTREQAIRIADGVELLTQDGQIIDALTGVTKTAPRGAPTSGDAEARVPNAALSQGDLQASFGILGDYRSTVNAIGGYLTGEAPYREAQQGLLALQNIGLQTTRILTEPWSAGRYDGETKYSADSIAPLLPENASDPSEALDRAVAVKATLDREIQEITNTFINNQEQWASDPDLITKAQVQVDRLQRLSDLYGDAVTGLETSMQRTQQNQSGQKPDLSIYMRQ